MIPAAHPSIPVIVLFSVAGSNPNAPDTARNTCGMVLEIRLVDDFELITTYAKLFQQAYCFRKHPLKRMCIHCLKVAGMRRSENSLA